MCSQEGEEGKAGKEEGGKEGREEAGEEGGSSRCCSCQERQEPSGPVASQQLRSG
jgi:hypothetical protein